MKILMSFILSFQLITASMASDLGQKKEFTVSQHLSSYIAKSQAKSFELNIRKGLELWGRKQLEQTIKIDQLNTSDANKAEVRSLLKRATGTTPKFKEVRPGHWVMKASGYKISFTLTELYNKTLKINGKVFNFKDLSLAEIESRLNTLDEARKSTSWFKTILNNTVGVNEAQAVIPFIVGGVIVGVILLTALYQLKWAPESAVENMDEIRTELEKDAATCNEANTGTTKYWDTFQMASQIGERSTLNSATSSSDALRLAIKEQIASGNRNNADCYELMHKVGEEIDVDIPLPSATMIQRMEVNGDGLKLNKSTDVNGAVYNLCQAYNALGSCMDQFVGAHINSTEIGNFKEIADPSLHKFKKATGAKSY